MLSNYGECKRTRKKTIFSLEKKVSTAKGGKMEKTKTKAKTAKTFILSIAAITILLSTLLFSYNAQRRSVAYGQNPIELDTAEKAAKWVISNATAEKGGFKWANIWPPPTGTLYQCSVHVGASGVGTFFLELHKNTQNLTRALTYLEYATGAAQWLISQAISSSGGYWWPHYDSDIPTWPGWRLSPDAADVGEFMIAMFDETGNSTYLRYAEGAAQWMIVNAESESGGYFIPYNPPGMYGSQAGHGISPGREAQTMTFIIHLFQRNSNSTYLKYINGTATWLISGPDKKEKNGGYYWESGRPYVVYNDTDTAARVASFFYEAHSLLQNETYLDYANGAVQWLLSVAEPDLSGYKWPDHTDDRPDPRYCTLPFMRFPDHPMNALTKAYKKTNNDTYLEYAEKHVNWVLSLAINDSSTAKFPYYESAATAGSALFNAEIYDYLKQMYTLNQNSTYLEYAEKALNWIVNNATESNEGYKWTIPEQWYEEATFYGASGIAYYLIFTNTSPHVAYSPTAFFSFTPATPRVNDTVTFNASESYDVDGNISTYAWDFGDGNTATETQPIANHRYTATGNYSVILTVTDNASLSNSTSKIMAVEKLDSEISLLVSAPEITIKENLTISGKISPRVSGANVTIMYRPSNDTWTLISIVKTDSNGEYNHTWMSNVSGTYEFNAYWTGNPHFHSALSPSASVKVKEKPIDVLPLAAITAAITTIIVIAALLVWSRSRRTKNQSQ